MACGLHCSVGNLVGNTDLSFFSFLPPPTHTVPLQLICPKGMYCASGEKKECPAGTYGGTLGLESTTCSGECGAGYFCDGGSTDYRTDACGDGAINASAVYCERGSKAPKLVTNGWYSGRGGLALLPGETRDASFLATKQTKCEAGFFCQYGIKAECGSPAVICAVAATDRTLVEAGYFSVGGTNTTRSDVELCPLGHFCAGGVKTQCPASRYGSTRGLEEASCTGPCETGYVCPAGSTSGSASNFKCLAGHYCPSGSTVSDANMCGGADVYCPAASTAPVDVPTDSYSTPVEDDARMRSSVRKCEPGWQCVGGVRSPCTTEEATINSYYCIGGERFRVKEGYYAVGGSEPGLASSQEQCLEGE